MNVNRHNYEEYFLLYVDNELQAADREAVELFLRENPDLEEELKMLQDSVVHPDSFDVFAQKEMLLKNAENLNPINETNCESWFVLYGDDELNNEEQGYVEHFVYKHPQYQEEFELIQKVKLEPDTLIAFPHKENLYRSEKADPVIVMRWWKIAVAAALILMMGGYAWYLVARNNKEVNNLAVNATPGNPVKKADGQQSDEGIKELPITKQPAGNNRGEDNRSGRQPVTVPVKSERVVDAGKLLVVNHIPQKQLEDITPAKENSLEGSNPKTDLNVTKSDVAKVDVKQPDPAAVAIANKPLVMDQEISFDELDKNDKEPAASYASNTDNGQVAILNTSLNNKNKMRSLFRKLSRVVGKATNIGPDEHENSDGKGVRIASFEIALK